MAQVEDRGASRLRGILVLLVLIAIVGLVLLLILTQGQSIMTALQSGAPKPTATAIARSTLADTATSTPAPTATNVIPVVTPSPTTASNIPVPTAASVVTATTAPRSTSTLAPTSVPQVTATLVRTATPTKIANTPGPTTSATTPPKPGGGIAYHRTQNDIESIAVYNLGNTTITPLVDVGRVGDVMYNTHSPIGVWSPDNTKFAYISTFKKDGPNAIKILDFAKNTNKAIFWTEADGVLFSPAWSYDGRMIAFARLNAPRTVWAINMLFVDGKPCNERAVCELRFSGQGEQYHGGLAWSSQGLFALGMNSNGGNDIYTMFWDGSAIFNLTEHIADDSLPAWSPDGKQIAFTSTRDGHFQIYVMNYDGTGLRRVSRGDSTDYAPTWSPDGNWIAYTSVRDGEPNIYMMDFNGNNVTRLTYGGGDRPSWSR